MNKINHQEFFNECHIIRRLNQNILPENTHCKQRYLLKLDDLYLILSDQQEQVCHDVNLINFRVFSKHFLDSLRVVHHHSLTTLVQISDALHQNLSIVFCAHPGVANSKLLKVRIISDSNLFYELCDRKPN